MLARQRLQRADYKLDIDRRAVHVQDSLGHRYRSCRVKSGNRRAPLNSEDAPGLERPEMTGPEPRERVRRNAAGSESAARWEQRWSGRQSKRLQARLQSSLT